MQLVSLERRELSQGELEFSVTVAACDVDCAIDEFCAVFAQMRGVDIPECEKSTPIAFLQREYPDVNDLCAQYVLNRLTTEIAEQQGIRAILTPRVHAEEMPQRECDFTYEINFVLYPEITLSSVDPVTISLRKIEVEEEDIQGQLDYIAKQYAGYIPDVPRPVALGDVVLVDVEATRNGRPDRSLNGTDRLLDVQYGLMPGVFIDNVLGMDVGESKSFDFELPKEIESGSAIDSENTEAVDLFHVMLTIKEQQKEVLPEINDEWVQNNLADFGSLEQLKTHIRSDLGSQKVMVEHKERIFAIRAAIAKRLQGTIPDALYEFSNDQMFKQFEKGLLEKGMSLDEYLTAEQMTLEHFQMTIFVQACEYLRQNLALDLLFEERGMSVSEQDVEVMKKKILPPAYLTKSTVELEASGVLFFIQQETRRQKAFEWLEETLTICDRV